MQQRKSLGKFIELLLPRILTLIQSTIDGKGMSSFGWRFLHFSDSKDFYDIDDALVSALDSAMSLLAEKDPDAFSEHAVQLRPLNYPVVQCLLTKGYAANGDRFADEAVDYLLEDTERLAVGSGNQKYWIARHTIESASGHCSDQNFQRLERAVLGFYPDYELEADNSEYKGSAQGILLGGMDSQRLSPDGARQTSRAAGQVRSVDFSATGRHRRRLCGVTHIRGRRSKND